MAKTTHRLTAVKVTNLNAKGLYPDGDGLYLRITATGTKGWIFRYTRDGKLRDMGLGPLSSVGLAGARDLAAECRRQRREGIDPIEARRARQAAERAAALGSITFKECAQQLIASHEVGWRNEKHRAQWRSTMRRYAYPFIGDVAVAAVDTAMVLKILNPLWQKVPETGSRVRGRIERVLDAAKARGLRTGENPCRWRGHLDALLPPRSKVRRVRHHPSLPYADLPGFMIKLRALEGITPRALEFVILTASRTSEVLRAEWPEFELPAKLWTVPAMRMKGAREHRVPLVPRAIAILKEMAAVRQSLFVFPGMREGQPLSNMALLMLLRELRPGVVTHGFRATFKNWCAECTHTPNFVSEAALAHVVADKVESAYRRTDLLEKRRKLMEAWAAFCGREQTSAKVVPMKGGTISQRG